MYEDDICYTFDDGSSGASGGAGRRSDQWQDERRGGRGRGRQRGSGRGRESGQREDDSSSMRRFSSAENLNRGRGGRGTRSRGGRGDHRGRDRGRDNSYDPSERRQDYRQESRGGGRGTRGGEHYRGRGNNDNRRRGGRPGHFPIRTIAQIDDMDDMTLRLNSQLEDFTTFMSQDYMSKDDTMKTLKVLSTVFQNDLQREIVTKTAHIVCTSHFLDMHLTNLIQGLSSDAEFGAERSVTETVDLIYQILTQVNMRMPSYSSKGYLLVRFLNGNPSIMQILQRHKPELVEGFQELEKDCQTSMQNMHSSGEKRERENRRTKRGPMEDDDIPPEDFASLPIFPSAQDMEWNSKIFLRANKEEGSFRDVNHYLDVQFRLMREDYIRPLRKGIKEFKQLKDRGEVLKRSQDLRLYNKVEIISMVCKDSLEHRLQFEMTPQLKRVRWQSSKRLLFGSLVCLSLDDFDTFFFAVVTDRDPKDLEKGIVQVRFETGLEEILEMSSKEIFTIAETTAYFEAYRHVLEGLKEMKDSLPMERYLVKCDKMIKPPKYLLSPNTMGKMDLTSLLKDPVRQNASSVTVINPQRWPDVEQTTLNPSQMEAVQTALSKELAIIQGPPGTGKTYVGLKVAEILLENRDVWTEPSVGQKPILVVCYTNHALDQFLEGILSFCPEGIVRVGSRCKNLQLEEFNLKNIRRKMRTERKTSLSVRNSIRDSVRALKDNKDKIDGVSARLEASHKGVVSAAALQHYMLPGQYDSLMNKGLTSVTFTDKSKIMIEWLSKGALTEKQNEEEDPYQDLATEMTCKILQGEGTCQESLFDPKDVQTMAMANRARLYRSWLDKVKTVLKAEVTAANSQGQSSHEPLRWLRASGSEILPDFVLTKAVNSHLYSAITQPLMQQHQTQAQFFVRAWLGFMGREPHEVISQIIEGEETCTEMQFLPQAIVSLPRKTRIHLYRSWYRKACANFKDPKTRKQARREILSDNHLMNVINPAHFAAITREMMTRHHRQSEYFIRSWLGIQEFCQNASHLEHLLDLLEENPDPVTAEEEGALNVEEEADIIQSSRQLDIDDDDDLFDFGKKQSKLDVKSAMKELGVQTAKTSAAAASDDGFSLPVYHQKKQMKKMKSLMASSKPMTEEEASHVVNLWSDRLKVEDRVRLYLFWLRSYQDRLRDSVKAQADVYNKCARELRELRMGEDKDILEEATIIGMTTTGAARYRRVLSGVACPIIILEEAAEVLEAHVVTTLHKKCQHLILIGDHQQLRPSPTVYELCRDYKLDLSLFERLINNSLHHSTLAVQHRMRPEVANLMRHVYPALKDHETTHNRHHIRGLKQDVFLFHHEEAEARNDETSSKSNQHEAELCVRLCRYLLQQGYPSESVTILTAYSGQVFALKGIMKQDPQFYQGVRVTAVDNYQGEENDIIILSLVRSNDEGIVGFLSTDNRVCVALSRARDGFYAFGNFKILAQNSQLWKNICRTAKDHGQLGDTLTLRCENHREQEIKIITAKDFDSMPEGGCRLPCGTRLEKCGHVCELSCHGYDRKHEKYKCRKKCERITCKEGHPCTKRCYEDCGRCLQKVTKTVPMCGHQASMECHRDPHTWTCTERCKGLLPCNHQCSGKCGECLRSKSHASECTEEVDRVWPCGHLVTSACNVSPGELPCKKPCDALLSCGHPCQGTCGECWSGRVHVPCKEKCARTLSGCGHKCPLPCGTICLPCTKKCGTACHHSSCKQPCGQPCQPCTEKCPWKLCKHNPCTSLCHDLCSPCDQPCPKKKLSCGTDGDPHPCSGLCGEKCFCFLCEKKNFSPLAIAGIETEEESMEVSEATPLIKLPQCGHIFKVLVLDMYMKKKTASLAVGHVVTCPVATCNKKILDRDCWRYHRLFKEGQARFQKAKEDLIASTTVTQNNRQKLVDSLQTLTHDAEKHKSFASKMNQGHLFKSEATLNINKAKALSNQIKMTKLFEASTATLKRLFGSQKVIEDMDTLQKILFTPMTHMTTQRCHELSAATRRFAYMTKLLCAKQMSSSAELMEQIEASLKVLKTSTRDVEVRETLWKKCQDNCGVWSQLVRKIDDAILDITVEREESKTDG